MLSHVHAPAIGTNSRQRLRGTKKLAPISIRTAKEPLVPRRGFNNDDSGRPLFCQKWYHGGASTRNPARTQRQKQRRGRWALAYSSARQSFQGRDTSGSSVHRGRGQEICTWYHHSVGPCPEFLPELQIAARAIVSTRSLCLVSARQAVRRNKRQPEFVTTREP